MRRTVSGALVVAAVVTIVLIQADYHTAATVSAAIVFGLSMIRVML
jgi:hypothetical protein